MGQVLGQAQVLGMDLALDLVHALLVRSPLSM
jgi:hypothetical protein